MTVKIIAEAGVNHNGLVSNAFKLVDIAKDCGADFIKFQYFTAKDLVAKNAPKADYQKNSMGDNQFQMLKKLELSRRDFASIKKYCDLKEIGFLCTVFNIKDLPFFIDLGIEYIKIPSGELTNLPYLEACSSFGLKVILSTGMSEMKEIDRAVKTLLLNMSLDDLTLLHCISLYPVEPSLINLNFIKTLSSKYKCSVGYSDHSKSIDVPSFAVCVGAQLIEKHFTIDRKMQGPDHKASLSPSQLKKMISRIKLAEKSLGLNKKILSPAELKMRNVARRSICASHNIKKGKVIDIEDLIYLRPGDGISPAEINSVIGTKAIKPFSKFEKIEIKKK